MPPPIAPPNSPLDLIRIIQELCIPLNQGQTNLNLQGGLCQN